MDICSQPNMPSVVSRLGSSLASVSRPIAGRDFVLASKNLPGEMLNLGQPRNMARNTLLSEGWKGRWLPPMW